MDLEQVSVPRRFALHLRELRQRAGRPSYSTLERLSGHELKRATVSDVLNANRVNVPDWRFVALLVEACRAAAGENGLDTAELGTIADWKRHWDSASDGVISARFPGQGRPSAMGLELAEGPSKLAASAAGAGHDLTDEVTTGSGRTRPSVWGPVPPRLPDFVGRQAWLTGVHSALAESRRTVVTVQGMLGIGKTQLAVEYAHRYAREYDLVWWISAG